MWSTCTVLCTEHIQSPCKTPRLFNLRPDQTSPVHSWRLISTLIDKVATVMWLKTAWRALTKIKYLANYNIKITKPSWWGFTYICPSLETIYWLVLSWNYFIIDTSVAINISRKTLCARFERKIIPSFGEKMAELGSTVHSGQSFMHFTLKWWRWSRLGETCTEKLEEFMGGPGGGQWFGGRKLFK